MKYQAVRDQYCFGIPIGILMMEDYIAFIPGDVGNATSYDFPVAFESLKGIDGNMMITKDPAIFDEIYEASKFLCAKGVRAITGDCGFMIMHQRKLSEKVDIPVFLSSLLQLPFIRSTLGRQDKIGIVTSCEKSLTKDVFDEIGFLETYRLVIRGLDNSPHFWKAGFDQTDGIIDDEIVKKEVLELVSKMAVEHPDIRAILLECSMLPPYAKAVQNVTGLPVFDFNTMINYVHSAVVQRDYSNGYM